MTAPKLPERPTKRRKKFDEHAVLFKRYLKASEDAAYYRKLMNEADAEKKLVIAEIKQKMGKAIIGIIAGMPAFELGKGTRKTATLDRVKEFAPEHFDDIVTVSEWDTIKPL